MFGFVRCINNEDNNKNFIIGNNYYISNDVVSSNFHDFKLDVEPVDVLGSTFEFSGCVFKRV